MPAVLMCLWVVRRVCVYGETESGVAPGRDGPTGAVRQFKTLEERRAVCAEMLICLKPSGNTPFPALFSLRVLILFWAGTG